MNAQRRLHALLNGGDWACAHAESGGLHQVCNELTVLVRDPVTQRAAREVARWTAKDMTHASHLWFDLANRAREASDQIAATIDAPRDAR